MAMATLSGLSGAISSSLSPHRHPHPHPHPHPHSLPYSSLGRAPPPPSLLPHLPRFPLAPAAQKKSSDYSGDAESKAILDAFFLGKALAETVSERLGSAVGEFLSEIGRQQAEQQKAIREFQEVVQERAKVGKTKAIRENLGIEQTSHNYSNGAPTYENVSPGTTKSYPPVATSTERSITSPTVVVEDPETSVSDITIEGGND